MRHISDYGAVGDGSADDTAAFQAMLDDGPGGCSIEGVNLLISAPVIIRGGRRLVAYGARVTGVGGHTLLRNFVIDVDAFPGYTGHSEIGVYGGLWDARGDLAAPGGPFEGQAWNAITFCHGERIVTDNLAIQRVSTYHALEYNSIRHGRINGVVARGFIDAFGTRDFSEAIQIDLAKEGSSDIGVWDRTHAQDVRVDSCYAGPMLDGSMGSFGALVGSHVSEGGSYQGIWVRDCTVENPLRYGVHGYGWDEPVIRGNRIIGAGVNGVRLENGRGGIVEGNVISGSHSNAVNLDGQSGAVVSGNQIDGTATNYGVYLTKSAGSTVTGNRIASAATAPVGGVGAGVRLGEGTDRALVSGNVVERGRSATDVAISCDAGDGTVNTVIHNQLAGYGAEAVRVESGTVRLAPPTGDGPGANIPTEG